MKFTFYGHACFQIQTEESKLLFDPFLTGNENAAIMPDKVECDHLLISHAHADHFGDAVPIAERTGAKVIAIPEIIRSLPNAITNVKPMNIGGTYEGPFGQVTMVQAVHSSGIAGGVPVGFIILFNEGKTLYFGGDTGLFGDMKLYGDLYNIDYAVLPIGGKYTLDPEQALIAAKFLRAKTIIPIHYNTWDVIQQDPEKLKKAGEKEGIEVRIIQPGESMML